MSKKKKGTKTQPTNPPSIGSNGLVITEDDLNVNKGEIHKGMLDQSSVRSEPHKDKTKYDRKEKHKKKPSDD